MPWEPKDPADLADYAVDWTGLLTRNGVLDPLLAGSAGYELDIPAIDVEEELISTDHSQLDGNVTIVRLSGGTNRKTHPVNWTLHTEGGQEFNATVWLKVKERSLE
jgi:hypothetical protein